MKVLKFKETVNIEDWKAQVAQRVASKLTVSAWCKQNNMTEQQYYYRLRKVREAAIDSIETQSISLVRYPIVHEELNATSSESETICHNKLVVRYREVILEFPEATEIRTIAMLMKALAQ